MSAAMRLLRVRCRRGFGVLALALLAAGPVHAAPLDFDVAAQPLDSALREFAKQSGLTIEAPADLLARKQAPAVKGRLEPEAALRQLLTGSGLAFRREGATVTVSRAEQPPAAEQQLAEVRVKASADAHPTELPRPYAGGQVAKGGKLGLLGNTDVMNAPFNITNYTAQTIEDQQARKISDVLMNDPSVRLSSAGTNINEDFSIRGFPVASQDVALNGMFGLMPYFRVPVEMAERIEVLKGPSALLNGMPPSGNIGGVINVVPKRAGLEPLARVTASYASDSILGAHVDVGRRFGAASQFGVRFNGAYRSGDTAIDEQQEKDTVGVLALDFMGERVRVSADLIHQRQQIDNVVRQFQAAPTLTSLPGPPDGTLNYPGYGRSDAEDDTGVLRGEFDLTDAVTVYGGYGRRMHHMDAVAGNPVLLNTAGDFTSTPAWQVFEVDSYSGEAGAYARFDTGFVRHRVSLGWTRVEQNADIYFVFAGLAPPRNSNIYTPVYSPTPSTAPFAAATTKYTESTLTSYAVADTVSVLDERVLVTLGARRQQVEAQVYNFVTGAPSGPGYEAHAVTPVAGLVVKPLPHLALYANYIEGLSQGPTAPIGSVNAGQMFAPFKSRQHEFGVKLDRGAFTTTVSYFQIRQPSAFLSGGVFGLNGEQRNRGLELNLFGEIARGVRLLGGGAYTQGELTKTVNGAFDGNDAIAVPRVQVNLGAEWDTPFIPGFTLTGRVIHTGRQFLDQANLLRLPNWTRFDFGARYRTRIGGRSVVFRGNIENAFDKSYWGASNAGYLYVGAPRRLLLSATVDF
jgi:iron complex outermembrane receptor protein